MIGALLTLSATALGWWLFALTAEAARPGVKMIVRLSRPLIAGNGVSTTTATATVTDASGNGVPGEVISLRSSDGRRWRMHHRRSGIYAARITSSTRAGAFVITAHDLSGAPPDAHVTLTQYGRATHLSLILSPPVILGDNTSFTTATATVTDALGDPVPADNVRFASSDRGQTSGPTTNHRNGRYSARIRASTTPGQATVTAKDIAAGIGGQATLSQVPNPSTTTLVVPQSPAVTNQAVTLMAAVTFTAGSPSGAMTFAANGAPIPGCVAERIAAASTFALCQTSFSVSTSPEQLTSIFTPDSWSSVAGSMGVFALTVGPDATSTSVSSSRSSVTVGASVTYTAVVSPAHPGPREPSGAVQFEDSGVSIRSCASQPLQTVSGLLAATCTVRYRKAGMHSIAGIYKGDSDFSDSSSNVVHVPVQVRGTVAATMQWNFKFAPSYTAVLALELNGAPAGATVRVGCRGGGCPFAKRAIAVRKLEHCPRNRGRCRRRRNRKVDLTAGFRNRRLRAGAHLVVAITRTGWVGKRYLFVMRADEGPFVEIACLAPGAPPGVGC